MLPSESINQLNILTEESSVASPIISPLRSGAVYGLMSGKNADINTS